MKIKNRKIHVVGINSFKYNDLSENIKQLFERTRIIAIPEAYFADIKLWFRKTSNKQKIIYSCKSNRSLISWLNEKVDDVVLISRGDPLWHGVGRVLLDNFSKEELMFYPTNTCLQIAFSRLKKPWQEISCMSIHGRDSDNLIKSLKSKKSDLAIITDPNKNSIEIIRKNLFELGLENFYEFWICEELGFENEKIRKICPKDKLPKDISDLNIIILLKKEINYQKVNFPLFGADDDLYKTFHDRPNLLTKREIRVQILSDLELPEEGIIWDIGAGSGTIGLEALKLRPKLKLYSIDKRFGTKKIISENARRVKVKPVQIQEKDIKEFIETDKNYSLNFPSRVIIGGCNKETKIYIIKKLSKSMIKGNIFVIPVITMEILQEIKSIFIELGYQINITLVQIQKGVSIAEGTRFEPSNPVFIIKAKKIN